MSRVGETPTEVWKPVVGYEGLYEISNKGRLWSMPRNGTSGGLIKGAYDKDGYLKYSLSKSGKQSNFFAHRLVAESFVPNPENKPHVNHLDEDTTNNNSENLQWCTPKENNNHGNHNLKVSMSKSKPIICMETGECYYGISECARRTGLHNGNISKVLRGVRKHTGGFSFKYI